MQIGHSTIALVSCVLLLDIVAYVWLFAEFSLKISSQNFQKATDLQPNAMKTHKDMRIRLVLVMCIKTVEYWLLF